MLQGNLFENIPGDLPQELLQTLWQGKGVRIERIVSRGHTTDWYDQESDEWVVLLTGRATLLFETTGKMELSRGQWLLIPAHAKHRVIWTSSDEPCVWLAVHAG